jgi:formylmethanofuran dehydrogenase subunit E
MGGWTTRVDRVKKRLRVIFKPDTDISSNSLEYPGISLNQIFEKRKQPGTGQRCESCGEELNAWEEESKTKLCFHCFVERNT